MEQVFPVSALHGRGFGELEAAIVDRMPRIEEAAPVDPDTPRVAIVGRPNAGKSSLVNRVLGEERMLVDDRPGTTRDAIDTVVLRPPDREGEAPRRYVLVDTAGIRRKGKVAKAEDAVESLSVLGAIRAMDRAEVVVLVCDAKEGVAEQDAKIAGLGEERGRAMVIALNKMDLLSRAETAKAEEGARDKLSFVPYVPLVRISAKKGRGIGELFAQIDRARAAFHKRIPTGELNRFFEQVLEHRPPPTMGGRAPRLYYITQAETAPPGFVAITNAPDSVHFSYRRFVVNQLRKHFGFEGVPIRVHYKEKRRRAKRPAGGESNASSSRERAAPVRRRRS